MASSELWDLVDISDYLPPGRKLSCKAVLWSIDPISNAISVKAEFSQIALKSSSQNLPISAWRFDWQSLIWTTHPQITKLSPDRGTRDIYNQIFSQIILPLLY